MEESINEMLKAQSARRLRVFRRERFIKWFQRYNWVIIAAMWAVAFSLGYTGFKKYYATLGETRTSWDLLYYTLQLFTVESGSVSGNLSWELEWARLLAPATTLYTALQALALIFREQLQRLRLRLFADHIVICGLGRRGLQLARAFRALGEPVAVIEHDGQNERIDQCREQRAIVIIGNASDPDVLREACVHRARYVIALCGDDGVNAEIAVDARNLVRGRRTTPLNCVVQIVDNQLLNLLRGQEMSSLEDEFFRLEFFNVFERAARAILREFPPFDQAHLRPHVLVVGAGRMGESVIAHAARMWRRYHRATGERLRMTVIDRYATAKTELLRLNFPLLEKVCLLQALQMDVTGPDFYRGEYLVDEQGHADVTGIYVCLDNDSRAMTAALALLELTRKTGIPVVARMTREEGLANLVQSMTNGREEYSRLHAFGLLDKTCTPELVLGGTIEVLARALHEEYVDKQAYSRNISEAGQLASSWDRLPRGAKEFFRHKAEEIGRKLRAVGCTIEPLTDWDAELFRFSPEEIDVMAKMEMDDRIRESRKAGRDFFPGHGVFDGSKDSVGLPWDKRSEVTRRYFRSVVEDLPAFLEKIDFQIRRWK